MTPAEIVESILTECTVSPNHRSSAQTSLEGVIKVFLVAFDRPRRPASRPPMATLAAVANLSEQLCLKIDQLDQELLGTPADWLFATPDAFIDEGFEEIQKQLKSLAENCRSVAPPQRPANRPRGAFQYSELRTLVINLYDAIVKTGHGKLTLSQDTRDWSPSGSLPATLEIL